MRVVYHNSERASDKLPSDRQDERLNIVTVADPSQRPARF